MIALCKQSDLSNHRTFRASQPQRILWLVERRDFIELLSLSFDSLTGFSVRTFSPAGVLEALARQEQLPDILVTAFYFDGGAISGLRIVQELRKINPRIPTIVTSGFPVEHVQGAAADWPMQPDYILQKGTQSFTRDLLGAIDDLHRRRSLRPTRKLRFPYDPVALPGRAAKRRSKQSREWAADRTPLVYLVGHPNCLRMLRAYAEEMTAIRFKRRCDYASFTDPAIGWRSLTQTGIKPGGLVADYYLNGGFINGLKLIKHAQTMVSGICTALVGHGYSGLHLEAAMEATGISPDWFFHE